MADKEKERKALEIYQQLMNSLKDVPEKAEILNIVNILIEEKWLSLAEGARILIKTSRRMPKTGVDMAVCLKCESDHVTRNGSTHDKGRFLCKDCGAFFVPTLREAC